MKRRELISSTAAVAMLGALPFLGQASLSTSNPLASTRHGQVRGYLSGGVAVFKGIRYGADTAARRFMPPRSPEPWSDVAEAFEFGHAAPQANPSEAISEDCLFLNVWTPDTDSRARRPVMFYIHGGAYSHGSGSHPQYDGAELCRRGDVVVVTVNHRLNAFGYLYLQGLAGASSSSGSGPGLGPELDPGLADSGNVGQLDLVLALRWVQENIVAFGGDPDRVLAFGQSGGGAKIATLMAIPAAQGLFHRVATMSGQQVTASGPANATARRRAFMAALGLGPEQVESLRQLPMEALLEGLAAADPVLPDGNSVYFGPVLDMRSLSRHPFFPDAAPQSAAIPMIIGNTRDETRAFLRDPHLYELSWEELPDLLVPNMRVDILPEYVVEQYRKLYPEYTPSEVFFAATTAARSWRGAIEEAEARARQAGAPTWAYQLDFRSPVEPQMRAPHMLDIALVFGNLGAEGSITGTGTESQSVSQQMSRAFIALARDGNPNHAGLPEWQPYTLRERNTMVFDVPSRLESDPRGAEREIFARVPYIQPGT